MKDNPNAPLEKQVANTMMYRWSWPKLLKANLVLSSALIVSLAANIAQTYLQPVPVYFSVDPNGRITKLVPVNEPYVTSDQVLDFAVNRLRKSFTFDFDNNNIRERFEELKSSYTPAGYTEYLQAMTESGLMDKIRSEKLVTSAIASGAAVVSREFRLNGYYTWEVEVPITMFVSTQKGRKSYNFLVTVNVQRTSLVERPGGIALSTFRTKSSPKIN